MSYAIKLAGGMTLALGMVLMAPSFGQEPEAVGAFTPGEPVMPTALPEEDAYQNPGESVRPASPLDVTDELGHTAHVFPQKGSVTQLAATTDAGPLLYHGGPIMPKVTLFTIYWLPSKLPNGQPATMVSGYQTILNNVAADYVGHDLSSITTQYYQTISGKTTYVSGLPSEVLGTGSLGGTYVDTDPYPASICKMPAFPGNCLDDAQLQAELLKVLKLRGWTAGLDRMYLVFTAKGLGSCMDAAGKSCDTPGSGYCAYHSHTTLSGVPVIYGNMPYANPVGCSGTKSSPNNNVDADTESTAVTHEVSEAITDPEGTGWLTAKGNEIGDLCAYNYGTNTYDGGKANQFWNGHYYEVQREFDNHLYYALALPGCSQVGP
jgi:hypothetical protein